VLISKPVPCRFWYSPRLPEQPPWLAELAKSYDVGISTILRATHLARQHDKVTTDV